MTDADTTPTPPAEEIRLLIVDDQPLIRRALSMTLATEPGIRILGQAADGVEAMEMAARLQPDIVIMDLQMPRASGVVATRDITARLPHTRVVVLTTFDHDELVFEAIQAGAHAYLLKDAAEAEVLETVRAVHRGEARLSPTIARKVMEQLRRLPTAPAAAQTPPSQPPQPTHGFAAAAGSEATPMKELLPNEPLSNKEERILELISQGQSNKRIAAAVFLAEGTVKNYVSRIMEKLHAGSRTELAVRAVQRRQ
ncbi:MAG: response regulator transcription factor [Burkholderiales bacterium]|nr:response regulator transcription factor [Burkholderiales bacterium]